MSKETALPVEMPSRPSSIQPAAATYVTHSPALDFEPEAPAVPFSHYLWILRRHLWMMIAFVASCVLATFIISARLKPIYESTATIDIDIQAPSEVVGQESTRSSVYRNPDQVLATQIKLIQSDAVLRPVAEQYHLLDSAGPAKGVTAEQAQRNAEAPVGLGGLRVIRPPNTYLLLISYRSPDPQMAADVANAVANSYLADAYAIRIRSSASVSSFMEKQLDELKAKMEQSGLALAQFEKDLDVVNPEEKTNILSARLLQLNTEYTDAQADRVSKEAAWNAIKSGSVEAAQVSSQGQSLAKLSEALEAAQQHFAVVKATYGTDHPEYRKAASELAEVQNEFNETSRGISDRIAVEYHESLDKEQMLQKTLADTKAAWDSLNARSFQYQQLKQEADADRALYDELIKKIRESDINAGFRDNNIRIADVARPTLSPVFPNVRLNLALALVLSSLLAVGAALLLDKLDTTLRIPEEASRFLRTDVIGTLPLERGALILPKTARTEFAEASLVAQDKLGNNDEGRRKGYYRSVSSFEEAIRTLRNTILLSDFEQRLRSIVVTSAEPGEGKTTLAVHLAIAHAARGKKTLIVDGDLRRPSVHAKFGLTQHEGLSNVLTGELSWRDVLLSIDGRPNLSILPAGPGSHRAADLIGPRLSELLDEFAKDFDLVILDSPPLLGFAECLQMASAADGVLIISRAGETKRKTVATVVSTLQRIRANIIGIVLNRVTSQTSSDGYSYYGYHYGYRQNEKPN
jgi:capsular exopolysaccharide synthesis family protein